MQFIDEAREQFLGTMANFRRCEIPEGAVTEGPLCNAVHDSGGISGSVYWYTEEGVYRLSNHWGEGVGSSNWYLDGGWVGESMRPEMLVEREDGTIESFCPYPESSAPDVPDGEPVCGFCPWSEFYSKTNSMYSRILHERQFGEAPSSIVDGRETDQRRLLAKLENQDIDRLMRDPDSEASRYFRGLDEILSKAAHAASERNPSGMSLELSPSGEGRFSDPERLQYNMRIYQGDDLVFSRNFDVKVLPLEIASCRQIENNTVNVNTGGYKMPPPAMTLESFCSALERTVGNRRESSVIREACGESVLRTLSDVAAIVSSYASYATRVNRELTFPRRMGRIARADIASVSNEGGDVVLVPPDGLDETSFLGGGAQDEPDIIRAAEFYEAEHEHDADLDALFEEAEAEYGAVPLPQNERPARLPDRVSPFRQSLCKQAGGTPAHLSEDVICDDLADLIASGLESVVTGADAPAIDNLNIEDSDVTRLSPLSSDAEERSGVLQRIESFFESAFSPGSVQSNFAGDAGYSTCGNAPSPEMVNVSEYYQRRRNKFGHEIWVRVRQHLRRNGSLPAKARNRGRGRLV